MADFNTVSNKIINDAAAAVNYINVSSAGSGVVMSSNNILLTSGDGFDYRSPKEKRLKTVKVNKGNIKTVAAAVVGKELDVTWADDGSAFYAGGPEPQYTVRMAVGDWVIEDYDYEFGQVTFRIASLDERIKYDLR